LAQVEILDTELAKDKPCAAPITMEIDKPAPTQPTTVAAERTELLNAYKRQGAELGIKITDKMIAKAASPTWNERTQIGWWKRDDSRYSRCTHAADIKIRAVLKNKPHLPG